MDPVSVGLSEVSSFHIYPGHHRPHDWKRYGLAKIKHGLIFCWLIISPFFIFLKNWTVSKYEKLVEIGESALDIVRAVGEVLVVFKELLWKIGSVFGKIGVMILRLTELFWNRQLAEGEAMERKV